jgi:glucuronate isomerase
LEDCTLSHSLKQEIFAQLNSLVLIDPHTHINPHSPASSSLADILGYHYYTELVHSAGMPQKLIEDPQLSPREKVRQLVKGIGHIDNTVQFSWLLEAANELFDLEIDRLDLSNCDQVFDAAQAKMSSAGWEDEVLKRTGLEAVFLTNDFDDPLQGFNTRRYIPCLRTDEMVFHLYRPGVQQRLQACSGISITHLSDLRNAIEQRFQHFVANGAKACAISLPPSFTPVSVSDGCAEKALSTLLTVGEDSPQEDRDCMAYWVFWELAENCRKYKLPFDLMIGVNRRVYPAGVYQGQDLYDSRVSMIQYQELLNAFPDVTFPISVLASVTNQELVSYAWIFPNVVCHGHWWYSNTPSFITRDLYARMEAVPRNKIIGYYSDMYKLEFALPKFAMFRRCLADVLANEFVIGRGWSENRAIEFGKQLLRGNVESVFLT